MTYSILSSLREEWVLSDAVTFLHMGLFQRNACFQIVLTFL